MRQMIINALKTKYIGEMNSHIANIEVMLTNPVGVGDHASIIDTVSKEILALECVTGRLNVLVKFFEKSDQPAIDASQTNKKER